VREAGMSASDWPSSPLDAAQRAFNLLAEPPTQVGFDGRGFDGLPDQILPLEALRDLLLSAATGVEARDAVWRGLVGPGPAARPPRRGGPARAAVPGLGPGPPEVAAGVRGGTPDLDTELVGAGVGPPR